MNSAEEHGKYKDTDKMSMLYHVTEKSIREHGLGRIRYYKCKKCRHWLVEEIPVDVWVVAKTYGPNRAINNWYHQKCYTDGKGVPIHDIPKN